MNRSFIRYTASVAMMVFITLTVAAQEIRSTGMASTYPSSEIGQPTASGEVYEGTLYTACHATLPFGTIVRVTNLRTNQSVLVTINDRFDYRTNRLIDVSNSAAKDLGLFDHIAPMVHIDVVEWQKEETSVGVTPNEG